MKAFPCTKCGACCRFVYTQKYFRDHGFLAPDGSCKHLQPDNTCGIYETRPEVCRMNGIYEGARLINIVPIEYWHDEVIDSTCRVAILRTNGDLSKLPAKNYDVGKMHTAVNRYLQDNGVSMALDDVQFAAGIQSRPIPGY